MAGDRTVGADGCVMSGLSPLRTMAGRVISAGVLVVVALGAGLGTAPSAHAQDPEFTVAVSDIDLDDPAGQTTVVLRLVPGTQAVAALSVELIHDPAIVTPTLAEPLSGGSCSVAEGKAQFGGFDPTGWTTPIELCAFTYVGRGAVAEGTLGIDITSAVNAQVEPITGATEPGQIRLGTPALPIATLTPTPPPPTPTPDPTATPEPTTTPTATPEPSPTPAPSAAPVPSTTPEVAAGPTETAAATPSTEGSDDDTSESGTTREGDPARDGAESGDRGSRTTPAPTDDVDGTSDATTEDPRSTTPVPTRLPGDETDPSSEESANAAVTDDDDDPSQSTDSIVVTTVYANEGTSPWLLGTATAGLVGVGLVLRSARRRTLRRSE